MVSFNTSLPECPTQVILPSESEPSSKKRKWETPPSQEHLFFKELPDDLDDRMKPTICDIELNLDTPLPSEWQRYLDIQSGQIHFFNTRTYVRTSRDPSRSTATRAADLTSLEIDLELNLTCESLRKNSNTTADRVHMKKQNSINRLQSGLEEDDDQQVSVSKNDKVLGFTRCPSWLSVESEDQEMVATVCMRCHMLVMLCKSSPACPNCKFMHPMDQNSQTLSKSKRCSHLS